MTVTAFLSIAAVAGILSASVSALLNYFVTHLERRRKARFLSLRLSFQLEQYALAMQRALYDHRTYVSSDGSDGSELIYPPKLPEYPDMPDVWPILNPEMANRTLGLRSELDQTFVSLGEIYDHLGDEGEWHAIRMTADFGHRAMVLSRDLRYAYGLSQTASGADLLGTLAGEVTKASAT